MAIAARTKRVVPGTEPGLIKLPAVTVAVVHSSETPAEVGSEVMKALYGAAYGLKFALKKRSVEMTLDYPRARWVWTAGRDARGSLEGDWALPVPDGTVTADLPQKVERFPVTVARWEYGDCAWVMHLGGWDEEEPTIARLISFIDDAGLEVAGRHEEWYLSGPSAKVVKTAILYPVRPRSA